MLWDERELENLLTSIYDGWRDLMDNKSDPRTRDWFLMSSPFPTIAISITYAYIVKILGPKLMENRKPFELRKVLVVYNFLQVLFSMYLFYEASIGGWLNGYSFTCEPVDYSYSPKAIRTARGCWWYFFSKFTEFFDTFFFVMRKRYDQVSTLHVIHHGIMPVSVWWGVKFTPGGHSTFFGFLNTFVHIIMYTYYMLAAMGPKVQKYLWWKKYLTVLQMVQFVLVMIHSFQLFFRNDCNYPIGFAYFIGAHAVMFYFLFSDFYKKSYLRRDAKEKSRKAYENGLMKAAMENGKHEINGNTKYAQSINNKLDGYAETTRQRIIAAAAGKN
ncbi:elongation of very long chain fatty acids protein 7 isoform X1 [Musca domestica]|uniref:Elongation of very long chain fatty acids protein n=1 Tax=Musca domestica TaxID=7370 RepID=A0ABM3UM40_MUSDO|nr:elongation of very long chain fatty acids protein 7 isoform X1 [Musca domestica]